MPRFNDFRDLPVLVTGFNRPELLNNVLSNIADIGMRNVWIVLDGPRPNNAQDLVLTKQCRLILETFESMLKNRVIVREENLGCKYGMASAITWFYQNNPLGVIIEDDLEFGRDFLAFQFEALQEFKSARSVGSVTGFLPIAEEINDSSLSSFKYLSHRYFCAWGWGSWSDRWRNYEVDIKNWRSQIHPLQLLGKFGYRNFRYWRKRFDELEAGKINSWDFQFLFTHFVNDWRVITPSVNFIRNVGFGETATHTIKERQMPSLYSNQTQSRKDSVVQINGKIENIYLQQQFGIKNSVLKKPFGYYNFSFFD